MCLAIPAKVAKLEEGNLATVDILGVSREISVDLTPQAHVGDYVLVHAGVVYYTTLAPRTSGLLPSEEGAAMHVSWMELLTFCLVIVAVIELALRLRQ